MSSNSSLSGPPGKPRRAFFSQCNNWISAVGAVVATGAFFAFFLLFILDATASDPSPYLGILTFMVAPFFRVAGLFLIFLGWFVDRWYLKRTGHVSALLKFSLDFSKPLERRKFLIFGAGATLFLFLSALGSYKTYHFTESNQFCGEVCHAVMEPEYVTYQQSPHARVDCVECHIGEGASWYVKSKIDGLYQVYATLADHYPRPIDTPIESLRPAQDTCENCHWPQVFTGNLDRLFQGYMSDTDNTAFATRLILKVGGGDPRLGKVEGIHWHTDPRNKVEYIAVDDDRQDIPWIRLSREGQDDTTVFVREGFDDLDALDAYEVRTMDCIDCHNRPAHVMLSPNEAVDQAFDLGRLDLSYPDLKYVAVDLLTGGYETSEAAEAAISAGLREAYQGEENLDRNIEELIRIYNTNFFPHMKADWSVYPNNIGHKNWAGCFRCHGGEHFELASGDPMAATDCNSCHTILAQGSGDDLNQLAPAGLQFAHPDGDVDGLACNLCHTGGLQ